MTKKYISCEPYTTFSLSYEQIHGDSPNKRQLGTFEFNNSTQTVFSWMKVFHNHSLNPVQSNGSPPHHRTSPQRPRLSVSFFGFTAIWEGSGRIRAALGWEISRWHRLHPLWSRQNIRSSCLRKEKAEGWNGGWGVGSSLPQEETARFTLQLETEERPPLLVNHDLLTAYGPLRCCRRLPQSLEKNLFCIQETAHSCVWQTIFCISHFPTFSGYDK